MLFSNAIRDQIKLLMNEQKLTISELARRAQLTQSTVDSFLNTRDTNARIDTVYKIIRALNLTVAAFFSAAIFDELE